MRLNKRARDDGSFLSSHMTTVERPNHAWKLFDVVNARIEHADIKAGAVLGACGVAAAALIGLINAPAGDTFYLLATAAVSGFFVLVSAVLCCGVLWPRRLRGELPESLIYFDHLARMTASPETREKHLQSLLADPESLSAEIVKQILATSRVASRKYDLLDRAMACFFAALITLSATALIFASHRHGH